jgi:hypothetical protein
MPQALLGRLAPRTADESIAILWRRTMNQSNHLAEHQATDDSGREKPRSTAGVITTRLLAVLVVALVIISITGFIIFDRQGGNSAAAVASLAIGASAAVLGLLLGFIKAYLTS